MKQLQVIAILAASALFVGCSSHSSHSTSTPTPSYESETYTPVVGGTTIDPAVQTNTSATSDLKDGSYTVGSTQRSTNQQGHSHAKTAYEGNTGPGLLMERYKSGSIEGYRK